VLVFPSETTDAVAAFAIGDDHFERLPADHSVRCFALFFANVEQGFVSDSFNISVTERVRSESRGAYRLTSRYVLLNLGANGAVIHEVAIPDDFSSMIDRDLRILKLAMGIEMSHPYFGDLAGGASHWSLVTLAAGLGVVEGAESIGCNMFCFLKKLLVGLAPVQIGKSIALVIESGDCLWGLTG
jgi:hypothetical protein